MREHLDLIVAILVLLIVVHRMRRVLGSKPFWTVHNSRRFLFAGSMLCASVYLLNRYF